ncbi:hypothetical protein A3K73_03995 [Candidatus Pacearchaeota archaeon RBG_13_36_9]|nr:MAG: hypothetical protein A3K73_03995 [Candidatus Pacearchaeota archaeon RBG_13_36_9]
MKKKREKEEIKGVESQVLYVIKIILGVLLIVLGIVSLFLPIIPGIILIILGLILLGNRKIKGLVSRIIRKIRKKIKS